MSGLSHDDEGKGRDPVLAVSDLVVRLSDAPGAAAIVDGIGFRIGPGETLGLTGPSGSGKTVTALALVGLGPDGRPARASGSIRLIGEELIGLTAAEWRRVRGAEIGFVPQDPRTSLTPVRRVGDLLREVIRSHADRAAADRRALELLREVGFPEPAAVADRYPHELSGGMQQRVGIAIALAGEPRLLIADEPTASLDVIARTQIMGLLESLQRGRSMSMLLISHDIRELASRADQVVELRDGRLGDPAPDPFDAARSSVVDRAEANRSADRRAAASAPAPPTRQAPTAGPEQAAEAPMLELRDVEMTFGRRGRGSVPVEAVRGASLRVGAGESVGLVGATGSGKSTLARCAVRLLEPTGGEVLQHGRAVTHLSRRRLRRLSHSIGMVFQNPSSSLNPTRTAGATIEAPLRASRDPLPADRESLVLEAARSARLSPELLGRLPRELSGGQQQRVALARALVTDPDLLILDEPFTALDHQTEAELADLLAELTRKRRLALLLITHDMRLIARVTDRVAVMSEGRIVEEGATDRVIAAPAEAATTQLVEAAFDL